MVKYFLLMRTRNRPPRRAGAWEAIMNERCLHTLEFDKIRERLAAHTATAEARRAAEELMPSSDPAEVRRLLAETAAACDCVRQKGALSFAGAADVRDCAMRLQLGAALSSGELLRIGRLLEIAESARQYGAPGPDAEPDALTPYFSGLTALPSERREIARCILAEDEIADDASSELRRIRRQLKEQQGRVRSELQSLLARNADYLQDSVIAMRNGRYCIPVKAEYKNHVAGMVHDQSQSGSTFFIEPMSILKLNNDIRELEVAEQKEIQVILASLSQLLAPHRDALVQDYSLLAALDFAFAKAALARDMKAEEPVLSDDLSLDLAKARHPLLDPRTVVPIDIRLGRDFTLLIITGPNTGGKTVALKTVGLLSLMGQAGLFIPAATGSRLCVFSDVWADIGDEQSIEQSLSTFSSHMTRIVEIVNHADDRALILFDELGAGTDPVEGAALATAILTSLHKLQIRTVATTHYSELKLFALSTDGVMNASCEFDVETLRPTYRLMIGVPGKSNAFAISQKLGLPEHLIDDARALIGAQDEAFEDVLQELDASRRKLEEDRAEAERLRAQSALLKKQYEEQKARLERDKAKIAQEAREEAARLLQETKDYTDGMISRITKLSQDAGVNKALEAERAALKQRIEAARPAEKKPSAPAVTGPDVFKIGDGVHVVSMNLDGIVTGKPSAKGYLPVKMGILNSQVHYTDLVPLAEETVTGDGVQAMKHRKEKGNASRIGMQKAMNVSPEINLIGMTTDQAIPELDKYLDDAYLAHLSQVRVVHGRGTGALRQAVHQHLKRLKYVKSYRLGAFGEGDSGVTIVTFDTEEKA